MPWSYQNPIALVFDEYDAGRPDVMFVIQRILEISGKLTLLDQNRIIKPHPYFRLFSTTNTVGLGDTTGLYHGTQQINQGQMDRWSIVSALNYLPHEDELGIVSTKAKSFNNKDGKEIISRFGKNPSLLRDFHAICDTGGRFAGSQSEETARAYLYHLSLIHISEPTRPY